MEKRKKGETTHWIMPGVFSGEFVVDEAVERVQLKKLGDQRDAAEALWKERAEEIQKELAALKEAVSRWEERFKVLQEEQKREREYLYQVVLSLKQEWERERNENRHH
ncbi:hypothetical protein EDM54_17585 [Brevibacillus borstelensis]|uniref:hypothetical protein n=1 Tax=Brevibacillus TaxID=55080 RepID=UPI00046807A5|nr:hypothetical protein [Brevibacillus borstelensis]MCC0565966.1 hypothetical protein [Brevibacillus borstelensis]MCM3469436.1 hypothetical protein [Brevibacillus borstelensis]MCM3557320.1 hypothetical protein [Brevibacillus borstelensis]MCM3590903.1 hypothetical protein [Brevibacillus borstelensis]MCM3623073.1 hypothetical protein [Brevibacillus borstelensis]